MTSRERVLATLNHEKPDRIPLDLGGSAQTGISASVLYQLRRELGLKEKPIRVNEPFQLLGEVEEDVRQALGVDIVPLWNPMSLLGSRFESWKSWNMPDGTPVLMGEPFEYTVDEHGNTLVYPQGDTSVPPSLKLPPDGFFFDNIDRAPQYDEDDLDGKRDFKNLYGVFSDEDARFIENSVGNLFENTDYAIHYNFGGGGFGDAAVVPGPYEKHPRGIRKLDEWYMAHYLFPDYIKEVFAYQLEVALKNLEIARQAIGDKIATINISGTDFGSQNGEMISPEHFDEFYKENYRVLNNWVHENTSWKTQLHCCGSIVKILPSLIDAGFDVLNPVQISAKGMDPRMLKETYGDKLTFWGGGVDTQKTLPFGTPDEVKNEVRERLEIFSPGGGFIFNTIHNIVGKTPIKNLTAMFDEVKNFNQRYTEGAKQGG